MIPGTQVPYQPAAVPLPPVGGAPSPAPVAGGAGSATPTGGNWSGQLFGSTANLPDWLKQLVGGQRRRGFKRSPKGGWMFGNVGDGAATPAPAPVSPLASYFGGQQSSPALGWLQSTLKDGRWRDDA